MKKTMKTISRAVSLAAVAAVGFTLLAGAPAQAAVGEVEPIDLQWSFEGVFGTYDRDALRRGYKVCTQARSARPSMPRRACMARTPFAPGWPPIPNMA